MDLSRFDSRHVKEINEFRKEHRQDIQRPEHLQDDKHKDHPKGFHGEPHKVHHDDKEHHKEHIKDHQKDHPIVLAKEPHKTFSPHPKIKHSFKSHKMSYSRSASSRSSSSSASSSSSPDLGHFKYKIGDLINEKYRIEEFLGDGTFGRVLECKNLENGELYAVKVI